MKMAYVEKLRRIRCDDCGRFASQETVSLDIERRISTLDACPIEDYLWVQCVGCNIKGNGK
jgi:hypothetical protein